MFSLAWHDVGKFRRKKFVVTKRLDNLQGFPIWKFWKVSKYTVSAFKLHYIIFLMARLFVWLLFYKICFQYVNYHIFVWNTGTGIWIALHIRKSNEVKITELFIRLEMSLVLILFLTSVVFCNHDLIYRSSEWYDLYPKAKKCKN